MGAIFTNMENLKILEKSICCDQVWQSWPPPSKQRSQPGHPDKTPGKSMARVRCVFPAKRSA